MPEIILRKSTICCEEIFHESGPVSQTPLSRGSILSIIKNPFAGRYVEDIQFFMETLKPLGLHMAKTLASQLAGAGIIEGYGKGAIVGESGEIEHGALWHLPGGYAMRELLGNAKAIVPSTKKVGGPGARLDVPITHINASYVRGHFDAMEVGCSDAPRSDELALVLVMPTGARIHNRAGGLASKDIEGKDGLR